jgi:hypothetical protein
VITTGSMTGVWPAGLSGLGAVGVAFGVVVGAGESCATTEVAHVKVSNRSDVRERLRRFIGFVPRR